MEMYSERFTLIIINQGEVVPEVPRQQSRVQKSLTPPARVSKRNTRNVGDEGQF